MEKHPTELGTLDPMADVIVESFDCCDGSGAVQFAVKGMAVLRLAPETALHIASRLAVAAAAAVRGLHGVCEADVGDLALVGSAADFALAARVSRADTAPDEKPNENLD